jgi:hypothetical protein
MMETVSFLQSCLNFLANQLSRSTVQLSK